MILDSRRKNDLAGEIRRLRHYDPNCYFRLASFRLTVSPASSFKTRTKGHHQMVALFDRQLVLLTEVPSGKWVQDAAARASAASDMR